MNRTLNHSEKGRDGATVCVKLLVLLYCVMRIIINVFRKVSLVFSGDFEHITSMRTLLVVFFYTSFDKNLLVALFFIAIKTGGDHFLILFFFFLISVVKKILWVHFVFFFWQFFFILKKKQTFNSKTEFS